MKCPTGTTPSKLRGKHDFSLTFIAGASHSKKLVLLVSDPTCKYVNNIDWMDVESISGANMYTIMSMTN
jgi:hypothetical protein